MDVQCPRAFVEEFGPPHLLEQSSPRNNTSRLACQGDEQVELAWTESDRLVPDEDFTALTIDADVADSKFAHGWSARATEQCAHSCQEFIGFEGFRDVVIGPEVEAFNDISFVIECGEHQNGGGVTSSDCTADVSSMRTRQKQVKDHEVWSLLFKRCERRPPIGGNCHGVTVAPQVELQELGNSSVVFDNENVRHLSSRHRRKSSVRCHIR